MWRLLEDGEQIVAGDQYWDFSQRSWLNCPRLGVRTTDESPPVRRALPEESQEPTTNKAQASICTSGPEVNCESANAFNNGCSFKGGCGYKRAAVR